MKFIRGDTQPFKFKITKQGGDNVGGKDFTEEKMNELYEEVEDE